LPSKANITTAVGDVATFQSTAANQVQCINYTRAAGTAIVAGSSGLPTLPSGITTDTSKEYNLKLTDSSTTETLTWAEESADEVVDDTTPQLGGDLDCNGNQIQWSKGADVASATALPLLTDGNYFDVTGTATVTSFNGTGGTGTQIKLHFDGACTLTDNADILLPGSSNIVTAAGDEAEFIQLDADKYRCTNYTKADGTPIAIGDETIDSDAYVDASIDFAHIQNVAANSVLGRDANSSGVLSEVALATTEILIGDGTGFTAAALSGDATMANTGAVTIEDDAVSYAKMQNVAADERILGRVSGADGVIEELTKSNVLTMLNVADGSEANVADTAITTADTSWSGAQRGTPSNVTDGTLDLDAANNFKYTPGGADTLEFSNEEVGQSGFITVINASGHAISLGSEVKKGASWDVSTAGTYLVSYYCDGTNVYVSASEALS